MSSTRDSASALTPTRRKASKPPTNASPNKTKKLVEVKAKEEEESVTSESAADAKTLEKKGRRRRKNTEDAAASAVQPPVTPKKAATAAHLPVTPKRAAASASKTKISPAKIAPSPSDSAIQLKNNQALRKSYSIIAKQRGFAYGTPFSPIYGENTETSMHRALLALRVGDSPANVYCDVGSGSGATCFHAACEYPNLLCYGFELMGSRWWISQSILLELLRNPVTSSSASRVLLAHLDLLSLTDFGPCTHVFCFDTGFPQPALKAFGEALNNSRYVRVVGSFQKPQVLLDAGFQRISLREQVSMKQVGSGEGRTLFVYDITREDDVEIPTSRSWDITGLYPPPTHSNFAPNVSHSTIYKNGEEARLGGLETYIAWVKEQIGLDRSTKMQTRSSSRRL